MQDEFEMSMMGEWKFFLGIQINQCKDGVYVHQTKYNKKLLKKFKLKDCKVMNSSSNAPNLHLKQRRHCIKGRSEVV